MRKWVITILSLLIVLFVLFSDEFGNPLKSVFSSEPEHLNAALTFAALGLIISLVIQAILMVHRNRRKLIRGRTDNFTIGMNNLQALIVFSLLLFSILSLFGINLVKLFTSLSIVAAALAIISKDYISNLISGFIITFSNEVDIEDDVKIGTHKGRVMDIGLTTLLLLNDDDDIISIPNNTVFNEEVINYTRREVKKSSIDFDLPIGAIDTVEDYENVLTSLLEPFKDKIRPGSIDLRVKEIKHDYLSLKLQYIVEPPDREVSRSIKKVVVRKVVELSGKSNERAQTSHGSSGLLD